ncbi:flagellar hook-length control protein FliK [Ferrovibrio terrae]|uniref:flagellar hook-length control protein FliK n=1 Tax=Ferrovibrio terrae TaxID=2594003 RepID=UPI003137F2C8
MQVTQVNNAASTALGQTPAEDTASRADEFARVLQSAFSGKGSEAVTKAAERAAPEAATRTETRRETRSPERPVADRPKYEAVETQRSEDDAAQRSESAPRETSPRETTAAKPAEKPAKSEAKPVKDAAQPTESTKDTTDQADQADKTAEAAPQTEAKDTVPAGEQAEVPVDSTASTDETLETAEPVVAVDADAALILLNLLTQAQPVATQVVAPVTETVVAAPVVPTATVPAVNPLDAAAAALVAAADALQGEVPEQTAAAAAAAAAAATMQMADDAAATVTADTAATMAKTATETSAAALLPQQQTVTPEDFAAIQQALVTQAQAQQGGKPVVTAETAPKAEPKSADKPALTIDVQGATTTAAVKPLVDQAALFAMQGDEQSADDAALLQQQAQAAQTPAQPAIPELKFNAALLQANAEAQLQSNTSTTTTSNNSSQSNQQAMSVSASSAPATQATQHTAAQTAARHLNPYIPAGEQVAVQIKKGVAEGADKISIKLDPGNLGKVEIKLEIGHDGRLMAVISADKPDTLLMLQRDASQLEQSLRDSGLKTDQQSLSFTLRDQGQDNNGRDGNGGGNGRNRGRGGDEYAETGLKTDPAQVAANNAQRAAAARGGLDIRI